MANDVEHLFHTCISLLFSYMLIYLYLLLLPFIDDPDQWVCHLASICFVSRLPLVPVYRGSLLPLPAQRALCLLLVWGCWHREGRIFLTPNLYWTLHLGPPKSTVCAQIAEPSYLNRFFICSPHCLNKNMGTSNEPRNWYTARRGVLRRQG